MPDRPGCTTTKAAASVVRTMEAMQQSGNLRAPTLDVCERNFIHCGCGSLLPEVHASSGPDEERVERTSDIRCAGLPDSGLVGVSSVSRASSSSSTTTCSPSIPLFFIDGHRSLLLRIYRRPKSHLRFFSLIYNVWRDGDVPN